VLEDPFEVMRSNGYIYGWTISIYEYRATIETLVGSRLRGFADSS